MKQSIIVTAVITFGIAFPAGLVTGIIINKSTVTSNITTAEAQARDDAAKAKEAVAQFESLKKQYEQLRNMNMKLSKELTSARKETTEVYNAQQSKIQSLQKEKTDLTDQFNQQNKAEQTPIQKTLQPEFVDYFNIMKVGQVTLIKDGRGVKGNGNHRLIAEQVVDNRNVICRLIRYVRTPSGAIAGDSGIKQLGTVWLTNFDTTGLVDNEIVNCNHYFIISGTKTYPTALGGTSTVFVLEPYER